MSSLYAAGSLNVTSRVLAASRTASLLSRAALLNNKRSSSCLTSSVGLRERFPAYSTYSTWKHSTPALRCSFSTTASTQLDYFPPPPEAGPIRKTPPAWDHPYTEDQMKAVQVAHREAKSWSDYVALGTIRFIRWMFDVASGYRHNKPGKPYAMSEPKWMTRFIFLETVAGVPGIVGGMLRHLRSLRSMKRDNGWMESLLEEAYNERMHLLTFMKMGEPGLFMRTIVLGAQAVFFGCFGIAYLISPRTCHRFVGYLEEEAVITYTRAIEDIDAGKLPEWSTMRAPDIAISYWKMPIGHQTMKDLLLYIRADEAKHREVNHTLGNLNYKKDPNPYVSVYKNPNHPHPTKSLDWEKPHGWERKDIV